MVGARWIMVTSAAPDSTRSAQMSWAEVEEPTTMHFWPRKEVPDVKDEEWQTKPPARLKLASPLIRGAKAKPDMPVASTRCVGRNVRGVPSRSTSTSQPPSTGRAFTHSVEVQ